MEENKPDYPNNFNIQAPQNAPAPTPSDTTSQPAVIAPQTNVAQPAAAMTSSGPVAQAPSSTGVNPMPVVKVLSPRGVEYVFLIICLFVAAISLASLLIAIVNSQYGFSVLSLPVSGLVVSVPLFSWLFLRLKKAELMDTTARLDASKRRSTQFTQIATFLVCFFTLIGLVTVILDKIGGNFTGSIVKPILDVLVIEIVSGGILFYYWRDEHRKEK